MRRFVIVLLLGLCAALIRPVGCAANAEDLLFAGFDPGPLGFDETRLVQTALAATGDYHGGLDGVWGAASQQALQTYIAREFQDDTALNVYAAALVIGFLRESDSDGWDFTYLPGLDVSLALPLAALAAADNADGQGWRSQDGGLVVVTRRQQLGEAQAWHDTGIAANVAEGGPRLRQADRMVTAGRLKDGWNFYLRSDLVGGRWSTVEILADPRQDLRLNLASASIRPGRPVPWDLPDGSRLAGLVDATLTMLDANAAARAAPPQTVSAAPVADAQVSTGTGFYLGARLLVTADHVVDGCASVTLADGTPLDLLAADKELDVAALGTPRSAQAWLRLSPDRAPRLGERVHAAGFPYYGLIGTSLNVTSGNVSALAGMDDDRRFVSFTAPVQPGNSGGPLLDGAGAVTGVVVARLSERYTSEETGTLPQNLNYALSNAALAGFLQQSDIKLAAGGLATFDMDAGAPSEIESAVVPVVCN